MEIALAQTTSGTGKTELAVNWSAYQAIAEASLPVQLTLFLLIAMSVYSWAVIVFKRWELSHACADNDSFVENFWKANTLDEIHAALGNFSRSYLARVFEKSYQELRRLADTAAIQKPTAESSAPTLMSGIDNLERTMRQAIETELSVLERRMGFLATIGTTAPFIGLFGTVWGIMGSFHKIGASGSASLAVVAPGISEALIATGVGLLTAIPASAAYNYYLNELKKHELKLNGFAVDFLNVAKRNFFWGQ